MNLRIVINSLIIILILHFFLINCDISIEIGSKQNNRQNNRQDLIKSNSRIELFSNPESNNPSVSQFRQNLLNYVKTSQGTISDRATNLDNNLNTVGAYNTYLSNTSKPNFNSNVADISKFFDKTDTNSYDNMNENQLNTIDIKENYSYKNEKLEKDTNNQNIPGNVDNNNINPQIWNYKNELPMNGGEIENSSIVGFDSLNSHYALYDSNSSTVRKCDVDKQQTNVQDLRLGKYSG